MAGGATSYDRLDLTRQRQDMMDEGLREQARESKREISFACDAIMYEQYVILHRWTHLSGIQRLCTRPLEI